jgi:hypothetical protein
MGSLPIALPVGGGSPQNRTFCPWGRCVTDAVAASVRLHRWGLGFRPCSFRLITRVLRDDTFSVLQWLPLFWHAVVPSGFRLQVNPMTQERSSEFLLTESGIQHRVPRHTVFVHPALQTQALLCVTVPLSTPGPPAGGRQILLGGSDGGTPGRRALVQLGAVWYFRSASSLSRAE